MAAFNFSATNLPSQIGEYNCSYFSTNNVNVPTMLMLITNSGVGIPPGGGPTWDFSQVQQGNESILRTDIIPPSSGMDGDQFSNATYAEQDTLATLSATNQTGWRYYSIASQGRWYYGFYVPNTAADGLAVFDSPTLDIPATVTNGQSWTRSVSWNTSIYMFGVFGVYYQFAETSTVDALGTLVLPQIGAMPALRVHEVHGYTGSEFGYTVETVTNQYYYWLVPGLGVAAQITLYGKNLVNGETPPFTNSVQRMYSANYFTNGITFPFSPVPSNLYIRLQGGAAYLSWTITNATSYQVLASGNLARTNWQVLGLTSNPNWTDALSPTQRYYRVVGLH